MYNSVVLFWCFRCGFDDILHFLLWWTCLITIPRVYNGIWECWSHPPPRSSKNLWRGSHLNCHYSPWLALYLGRVLTASRQNQSESQACCVVYGDLMGLDTDPPLGCITMWSRVNWQWWSRGETSEANTTSAPRILPSLFWRLSVITYGKYGRTWRGVMLLVWLLLWKTGKSHKLIKHYILYFDYVCALIT